jgi:hypothetical protein
MILLAILPMLPPLWSASLGGGTTGSSTYSSQGPPGLVARWHPLLLPTIASACLPRRELPILGCCTGAGMVHLAGIRQAFGACRLFHG